VFWVCFFLTGMRICMRSSSRCRLFFNAILLFLILNIYSQYMIAAFEFSRGVLTPFSSSWAVWSIFLNFWVAANYFCKYMWTTSTWIALPCKMSVDNKCFPNASNVVLSRCAYLTPLLDGLFGKVFWAFVALRIAGFCLFDDSSTRYSQPRGWKGTFPLHGIRVVIAHVSGGGDRSIRYFAHVFGLHFLIYTEASSLEGFVFWCQICVFFSPCVSCVFDTESQRFCSA
jgi:hypothetical protein